MAISVPVRTLKSGDRSFPVYACICEMWDWLIDRSTDRPVVCIMKIQIRQVMSLSLFSSLLLRFHDPFPYPLCSLLILLYPLSSSLFQRIQALYSKLVGGREVDRFSLRRTESRYGDGDVFV